MTTEERVGEYYRWVLDRLKELLDTSPSNKPIRYELSHVAAAGVPNNETEENIVRKLDELGAVKITGEFPRTWEYNHNGYFELLILQPRFDELCRKFGVIEEVDNENDNKPQTTEPKFLEIENLPEDTLQPVWWLFKRIKKEYLATSEGEEVLLKFVPGEVVIAGNERTVPDLEDQKLALRLLQRMGVIKIKSDYFTSSKVGRFSVVKSHVSNGYYLDVLQPRFDQVYEQYKKEDTAPSQEQNEMTSTPQEDELPDVIQADLEAKLSQIETETDDHMFYLKIAVYGKYLVDHHQLNYILKLLYEDSIHDSSSFKEKWKDFYDAWRPLAQSLVDLADKEGIKGNPNILYQDLAHLKQRLAEPEMSFWSGDIHSYYVPYNNLIGTFVQTGKAKLIVPKFLNKDLIGLSIDPKYRVASEAWDLYAKLREVRPWWAHYQVMRLTGGVLDLQSLQTYFNEDSVVDSFYKYEFKKVGSGGTFVFLRRGKFMEWIKTLHKYIIPRLAKLKKDEIVSNSRTATFSANKWTKRDREKELRRLKKLCDLSNNEGKLLEILLDFEPQTTKDLKSEVLTRDLPHLKKSLDKKIRKENYWIDTNFGGGFRDSYYILKELSNSSNK